ncbi:MAG: nucleotidyltransferase domain-containing protein [Coriobacteriales bacterium]
MKEEIDIDAWIGELVGKLQGAFGERLKLVGLQGSRARGEAREGSDIDAVVIVEGLSADDLAAYRELIAKMPHGDLACGFISSPELLAVWPRHDVFNLVEDTRVLFGAFDFMDTGFTAQDALLSAKVGASEIYHAVSHELVFNESSLQAIVDACVKSTFFVMRALRFVRTGEYPPSRAAMRQLASEDERVFLDAYDDPQAFEPHELAERLLAWSQNVILAEG